MPRHLRISRAVLGAVLAAALAATAGCGSNAADSTARGKAGATSAAPSPADADADARNTADITFVQMMIPHEKHAVDMAAVAELRASDPELKALAQKIRTAREPDVAEMTGWLKAWGQTTVPAVEHGDHAGPGMRGEEDIKALKAAKGTAFDRMFAQMMIAHHNGSIEMAQQEQVGGVNIDAQMLAVRVLTGQQEEIKSLQGILDRL